MRLIPAIIIAVALILAPVIWIGLNFLLNGGESESAGIDPIARSEIEGLRQQIDELTQSAASAEKEIAALRKEMYEQQSAPQEQDFFSPSGEIQDYTQVVRIVDRRNVNRGLFVATPAYLETKLGRPRDVLSDTCEEMTNIGLASKLVIEQVGPIRVRMLSPAVESLKRVFDNIQRADPSLFARIDTAGSLCVRQIRNSINRTSTHSFGLAVDLNIDGILDTYGDGKTQLGLTIIADFFHAEGWVWGASFPTEDSMHFEISRRQLDEWLTAGLL